MQRQLMNTTYLQSKISRLHSIHNQTITEYGDLVESLTEECDILCEIIPGYKISATLEGEDGGGDVRKKKEVYNVEKLEHELLKQYQRFLQLIKKLSKKQHPEQQALGSRLLAKLIPVGTEFNHNSDLLRLGVDFANNKHQRVAQPCLDALSTLLDGHMVTEATDHIVGAILAIVRKKSYAINAKILSILLHVRVAMVDVHRKDITEEKAKNKRLKKEDKELARQMQKSKARRDRAEMAAKQTKIIHRLFVVYLRVMESAKSCSKQHQARILAPTLEGLVKFAPLVNLELFHGLMKALRELLEEDILVSTKMHALVAVASLAKKDDMLDASEWKVDLAFFHETLFQALPEALTIPVYDEGAGKPQSNDEGDIDDAASQGSASVSGSLSSSAFSIAQSMANAHFVRSSCIQEWTYRVGLVIRTVDLLVLSQKHIPLPRVMAFCRRILQYLSGVPAHISMALTVLVHRLTVRYPSTASLVIGGADNVIGGRGVYDPDAETTSSAHAECSFAWEVSLYSRGYHPTQRKIMDQFIKHNYQLSQHRHGQAPIVSKQLNLLGPYEVLEAYDSSLGDIKPTAPIPVAFRKKNGLVANGEKRERD
eukprot:Tbor_TRINITY_DN4747_c0_g1::TRINITY_DN4747_c0_g1_i1::g.17001::m.17001/K14834/NOC3; nucleolar complex protein 3